MVIKEIQNEDYFWGRAAQRGWDTEKKLIENRKRKEHAQILCQRGHINGKEAHEIFTTASY